MIRKKKNLQKPLKEQKKKQRSSEYQSALCVQINTPNTVATELFQSELICYNRKKNEDKASFKIIHICLKLVTYTFLKKTNPRNI